ncbi:MAG: ribonucleotide-diphosphate reductase subunit beta [Sphaerochaetaceae bacterium]
MEDNKLVRRPMFNEHGDITLDKRKMVGGNTTNLNDFNNIKYGWVSDWYRQAMNNFWVPEEINMNSDVQDYRVLDKYEKEAYDKVLSFLIFLDSVQTANLPNVSNYITANEVNLCLTIQSFQEAVHSQSYGYMLDTICAPDERTEILYQWKNDEHLLKRNRFIGSLYNEFQEKPNLKSLVKTMVANYILEGVYFYSGFMFFYNLGRNSKMPGSVQEIRYINRDENTHLWLFRSILLEMQKEEPQMFTEDLVKSYREMIKEGCEMEIEWGHYVIGDNIAGLNKQMVTDYIQYLGNLRATQLGFEKLYEGHESEPDTMHWVSQYSNANHIKTDFFEAKSTAYAKSSALIDDL